MKFNNIDKIILIGGSFLLAEFTKELVKNSKIQVVVFSSKRHLDELVGKNSLRSELKKHKIIYYDVRDINDDKRLKKEITKNTLGIAMGASWIFAKKTVKLFPARHLLDVMNMDLPRYRGGAHYTWRILHQNRKGCLSLQIINGGKNNFHKGKLIKREEFAYPAEIDMFNWINYSLKKEVKFLKDFLKEIKKRVDFKLVSLDERESSYFPFLFTKFNGLIDWSWRGQNIYLFIKAFDNPYPGASTFLNNKKVYFKEARLLPPQEKYHPFTSGIVVRKDRNGIYIATVGNLLFVKKIFNESGKSIMGLIELGDRFYTPQNKLVKALTFKADYDASGLKKHKK